MIIRTFNSACIIGTAVISYYHPHDAAVDTALTLLGIYGTHVIPAITQTGTLMTEQPLTAPKVTPETAPELTDPIGAYGASLMGVAPPHVPAAVTVPPDTEPDDVAKARALIQAYENAPAPEPQPEPVSQAAQEPAAGFATVEAYLTQHMQLLEEMAAGIRRLLS